MKNRSAILFLGDIAVLAISFFAIWLREGKFQLPHWVFRENIWAFSFVALVTLLMLYAFDLYDFRHVRITSSNLWRLGGSAIISPIIGIIFFYALPIFHVTPKTNLFLFFATFTALFILWRRTFVRIFSVSFRNKTVVWGSSETAIRLFSEISHNPHRGYDPLVLVSTEQELIQTLDTRDVHVLVIEDALELPDHLIEVVLKKRIVTLSLSDTFEAILQKIPVENVTETSFIQNVQYRNGLAAFAYTVFECTVAIIILITTSPFLAIAAIAIKIEDGGSIFYTQPRMGYLGTEFMLYKFRSMQEEHRRKDSGADWTTKNDSRITRIGKILRLTHIDEIPQMINVLRGEIGLVGPRPDVYRVEADFKKTIPHYHLRHTVRPGFTGWAQIKYRAANSSDSFLERFQYDLYYIKNRNFFFDLGILVRTIQIIISHSIG